MSSTQKKFMSAQNFHINPHTIHQQTNLLPDKGKNRYISENEEDINLNNREAFNNENSQLIANKGKELNENLAYITTPKEENQDNLENWETPTKATENNMILMKRFRLIRRIIYELK